MPDAPSMGASHCCAIGPSDNGGPICRVLPIAPSTYYANVATARDPSRASGRARRDAELMPEIRRVWEENLQVYGVCKVWRQLRREGFDVAVRRLSRTDGVHLLTTVARLMKKMGIQGVIRGKPQKTTIPDPALPCPRDKVNRQFRAPAPNRLWGRPSWRHRSEPDGRRLHIRLDLAGRPAWPSDQWRPHAELYVAFVIDTFADRIVGWRASRSRQTQFVLPSRDHGSRTTLSGGGGPRTGPARAPSGRGSDPPFGPRRSDIWRCAPPSDWPKAGLEPSVAAGAFAAPPGPRPRSAVGDGDDDALAEIIIGLLEAAVIHRLGPLKTAGAVEWETLNRVARFDSRRLLGPIGHIPPAEAERTFLDDSVGLNMVA